ncbi:HAD family hydrolase [Shewanella maritima]|uniref:phosphoglycolate phosphatase n=1 Tax=Shewanella maritima TaxID=2520507 RepID=A0A411PEA4_9GAMM|nr:HAD hydrolase-like protein [Shewanella maritima]QBF81871.1 HAD family hydrolase [Shewanella maritima]
MPQFNNYEAIIFDCDGVILDSNQLKIEAMRNALVAQNLAEESVNECVELFAKNFGRSRFYHVDIFCDEILDVDDDVKHHLKAQLLQSYSQQCKKLYMTASLTPSVEVVLQRSEAVKYVASGSEQNELNTIFERRGLAKYFSKILGSPTKKTELVRQIVSEVSGVAVMIGDARSDLEAAQENNIDFIYYSPYSNVDETMRELAKESGFRVIDSFDEILGEL